MTDEQIEEIYTLGRLAFQGGQRSFQVQAYPVPHDARRTWRGTVATRTCRSGGC